MVVSAGLLLGLYLCLGTWGQFDFTDLMGYYNMLADAFLDGQLHIVYQPERIRLQDMIPFEGRYYLQWGPLPGILHALPKLFGITLSDRVACLAANWLASLVFLRILLIVRRRWFPATPLGLCRWFFFAFALATPTLLLAFQGSIYHESIGIAALFALLSFLAFLRYGENLAASRALASGVWLGLAVTSRISLALDAIGLLAGIWVLNRGSRLSPAAARQRLVLFAVPVLAAGALMMGYNYARFRSPFDYGLSHLRGPHHRAYNLDRIPENLRHYLLSPIRFSRELPWISHTGWLPLAKTERAEGMSSMFLASPFLLLAGLAASIFRKPDPELRPLKIFLGAAGGSALLVFFSLLCFDAASRRYMQDFVPLLMILAFTGAAARSPRWRRWRSPAWAMLCPCVLLHVHMSLFEVIGPAADPNAMKTFVALAPTLRRMAPSQKLDDFEAITHNDLGVMDLAQRRYGDALRRFERAAERMPHAERIRANLELARRLTGSTPAPRSPPQRPPE